VLQHAKPAPTPPPTIRLRSPVMGIEAEFEVHVDGERVIPETYWGTPGAFITLPLGAQGANNPQLPTGGSVYFDQGVIEVVTPVIELAPGCSARAVRNLWEQIGFVRDELTRWGARTSHEGRLAGFSAHYNISFDPGPGEEGRTAEALAQLLSYILPLPVALVGGNRRSTGVGVRPRGNRIEVTFDFTPDPGLMVATATLILGVVRGVMDWPSYHLDMLDRQGIPVVEGVTPGKHSSRQGWLVKDFHFERSPFTTAVDLRAWTTRDGRRLSLRALSRDIAWRFRRSIRRDADPFSFRLLFAVLEGQAPSLLELPDRPAAYDDVGRGCRWGDVLPELLGRPVDGRWEIAPDARWSAGRFDEHLAARERERQLHLRRLAREARRTARGGATPPALRPLAAPSKDARTASPVAAPAGAADYRGEDRRVEAPGTWADDEEAETDRRLRPRVLERRIQDRPGRVAIPFPDRFLTRSSYEQVFLRLVSGGRLRIDGVPHAPVGMRGWYHAAFRDAAGAERLLSIDELLDREGDWLT
jgi:hypothetical protein